MQVVTFTVNTSTKVTLITISSLQLVSDFLLADEDTFAVQRSTFMLKQGCMTKQENFNVTCFH